MNIKWNKVTWYSKLLALSMFIVFPIIAFCLGIKYEKSVNPQLTITKSSSNQCKAGEVALFEGGNYYKCLQSNIDTNKETQPKANSNQKINTVSPTPNITSNKYTNPCSNNEVALYEGGIFSGCAKSNQ